jgi:signal recognition particle subunit SRP54
MMVGLQGSGKTTTTAKIAKRLTRSAGKKVLMASLDVNRPAAQEQLAVLGTQAERRDLADRRRPAAGRDRPRALQSREAAGLRRPDARHRRPLHVDEALMDEMKAVADIATPQRNPARRRR